jgi:hypothetical protein
MYSTKQLQMSGMENRSAHRVPSILKTGGTQLHAVRGEKSQYTVCLLSFRTDCAERILRVPSGGHPQKHIGASLDTLCA